MKVDFLTDCTSRSSKTKKVINGENAGSKDGKKSSKASTKEKSSDGVLEGGKEEEVKLNPGYTGEKDSKGLKNGRGSFLYGIPIINPAIATYIIDLTTFLFPDNGDLYEGEWKNNKKHGAGRYKFSNGDVYEGEFKAGFKHGKGVYRYSNGERYEGDFVNNVISGTGKYDYNGGAKYSGEFKANAKHGHGVFTYPDGATHEGTWVFGEAKGHGRYSAIRSVHTCIHTFIYSYIQY